MLTEGQVIVIKPHQVLLGRHDQVEKIVSVAAVEVMTSQVKLKRKCLLQCRTHVCEPASKVSLTSTTSTVHTHVSKNVSSTAMKRIQRREKGWS